MPSMQGSRTLRPLAPQRVMSKSLGSGVLSLLHSSGECLLSCLSLGIALMAWDPIMNVCTGMYHCLSL